MAESSEYSQQDAESELAQLRKRVAELEVESRRFRALVGSNVVSVQVYRADGLTAEVNSAYEKLWQVKAADVAEYNVLADPQIRAFGITPLVERVFNQGVAMHMPSIRYDPQETESISAGQAAWVASAMAPVVDPAGQVQEVIHIHLPVGELMQSEEELREQNRRLEEAVRVRTAELESKLALIGSQQQAIRDLSVPVLQLWTRVLALPLIGHIDADRGKLMLESLLRAVTESRAECVLIDVTGVPEVDVEAIAYLRDAIRATGLLGSRCMLVGISPTMAESLVALDVPLERVPTFATLQDGLREALTMTSRALRT
ncbi:STAS domain-containing protein [Nannocystis pusilla]|uniref:STAS domain-containing protein n=1 Tax=Nannocystis pusilla TaxID=889268 RepID=A0ABS7U0D0_9BACT|nr:STAS domain-containing protein [Nannocystis pusilla]MBZ5713915.1 STAS domain-containing protein [Nannocystis pusilla]